MPAAIGFLSGGAFLLLIDKMLLHLHLNLPMEKAEDIKTSWERSILLILAITLHDFPEDAAIPVPLRRESFSRKRAFWYRQLSGVVEPIAGVFRAYWS